MIGKRGTLADLEGGVTDAIGKIVAHAIQGNVGQQPGSRCSRAKREDKRP
jgi:hypothetical protein